MKAVGSCKFCRKRFCPTHARQKAIRPPKKPRAAHKEERVRLELLVDALSLSLEGSSVIVVAITSVTIITNTSKNTHCFLDVFVIYSSALGSSDSLIDYLADLPACGAVARAERVVAVAGDNAPSVGRFHKAVERVGQRHI